MIAFTELVLFSYFVIAVLAIIAWSADSSTLTNLDKELGEIDISIVVPFRNEAPNLKTLIDALKAQQYKSKLEFILVDDHSNDNSLSVARQAINEDPRFKILQLQEGNTGKKAALQLAVNNSSYNHILQCDADCKSQNKWVNSMAKNFQDKELLLGPVSCASTAGKWNFINKIETAILQLITQAGIYYKYPIMANGANLMYTKKLYLAYVQSGVGQEFASGDDQFLLNYCHEHYPDAIKYNSEAEALIETLFPASWKDMIRQRARWAQKNTSSSWHIQATGIILILSQILFPVVVLYTLLVPNSHPLIWEYFLSKLLVEAIFVFGYTQRFNKNYWTDLLLASIVYPFFVWSVLQKSGSKKNTWKERDM